MLTALAINLFVNQKKKKMELWTKDIYKTFSQKVELNMILKKIYRKICILIFFSFNFNRIRTNYVLE